jgi:hypothetical protein
MNGCPKCKSGCGFGATSQGALCCTEEEGLMRPTLENEMRTYDYPGDNVGTLYSPWRAPGYAPVGDPCGLAGGASEPGGAGDGGYPPNGIEQGFPGSELPELEGEPFVWKVGEAAEVSWDITANHGGGYSYRLCPKERISEGEACFAENQLDFVGDVQWIDSLSRGKLETKAFRTTQTKNNATWTRNPIPPCSGAYGGALNLPCRGSQFEAPLQDVYPATEFKATAGIYGFGSGTCDSGLEGRGCTPQEKAHWVDLFDFNIVDLVRVPELPSGEYLLSFRWDGEQTPQIWAGCSDVTIVNE